MLIDTTEKFETVLPDLLQCRRPVVDVETNGLNPWGTRGSDRNHIIGIAIDTGREAYYFPYRHREGTNLPWGTFEFFRRYLSNPDRVYGGYNYKFDQHMLWADGVEYADNIEDAMLSAHLLNENEPSFRLKSLGDRYLSEESSLEESELLGRLREIGGGKSDMDLLPPELVEPYATQDVRLTRGLLELHRPALEHWGLLDLWKQVNYYSVITSYIENRGILIDVPLVEQYREDAVGHYAEAMERLRSLVGRDINPNSSPQVCGVLDISSSAAKVLERLAEQDDERGRIAAAVIEARGWKSVDSRYYTPYLESIDESGVLRTSLNLHGTISGRLSSSNPNLQAVARRTDVFRVKDVFRAREGYTLISMDYSQAEMRLASCYAREETMAGLIRRGEDLHSATAERLGIPRDAAKRINFGVIYGIGAGALSDQLGIERSLAQKYLNQYHKLYPGFRSLMNQCVAGANRDGYIRMWTGRMRHYDERNPTHKSMSNLIQGGVAEIMRVAVTRGWPALHELEGFMLLQVHDQIIYEVPTDNLKLAVEVLRANMEDFEFDPKMVVDVAVGQSWGGMTKW